MTYSRKKPSTESTAIITIVVLLVSLAGAVANPDGKIQVAAYSRSYARISGGHSSLAYVNDPMMHVRPVPVIGGYSLGHGISPDEIRRAARIYFPRTYQQLLENDVTVFQEAPLGFAGYINFDPKFLLWCKDYVIEGGKALDMYGGDASFGAGIGESYPSWETTPVADVLPVEIIPGGIRGIKQRGGTWGADVMVPKNIEFPQDFGLSRLPWDSARKPHYDEPLNAVEYRPGSTRVAVAVTPDDSEYPFVAYWEIGEGSSLAYTAIFASGGTGKILDWKWYPDFITYLVYHSAGVPMPENIYLPHVIREKLQLYLSEKEFAYNYADFISKLGGNTVQLERRIAEVDETIDEVEELYMAGSYEESRDVLLISVDEMSTILQDAKDLEKSVMMWIYIIEWFAVVGTFLVAGLVLNYLMIRRTLYREVAVTRRRREDS